MATTQTPPRMVPSCVPSTFIHPTNYKSLSLFPPTCSTFCLPSSSTLYCKPWTSSAVLVRSQYDDTTMPLNVTSQYDDTTMPLNVTSQYDDTTMPLSVTSQYDDTTMPLNVTSQYDDTAMPLNTCAAAPSPALDLPMLHSRFWNWRGYSIRYQCCGSTGPALLLIHGFGANSDHWRKNLPVLAKSHRVFSIDLLGYGYSDKPNPRDFQDSPLYTFETWGSQMIDFCLEVVKSEAFFICNSIGGLVGLQAAVMAPHICKGLVLLNISLRMLHIKKQPPLAKPFIKSFQNLLRNTSLGKLFFRTVATPQSVRNILSQCYHDTSQVTEELVDIILKPGLQPGAVDVFLEFICYSDGPLPEELLPQVKCPVLIGWGDKDPWEPIDLGRAYGNFDSVEDFVVLPNVGHCPQDEAPDLVNQLVESFVSRHSNPATTVSVP